LANKNVALSAIGQNGYENGSKNIDKNKQLSSTRTPLKALRTTSANRLFRFPHLVGWVA
jgi:hypothetical protein